LDADDHDVRVHDRHQRREHRRGRGDRAVPAAGARGRRRRDARLRAPGGGDVAMALRRNAFTYGVLVPFAIVLAFPFVWMLVTSLKPESQVYDPTKTWNFHPTLHSYSFLFHQTDYVRWIENSCFVGLLVVLITLVVALPAGYALARLSGR